MKDLTFKLVQGFSILLVALFFVLAYLKLNGYIFLSWWWVWAPLLAPFAVAFIIVIAAVLLLKYLPRKEDNRKP